MLAGLRVEKKDSQKAEKKTKKEKKKDRRKEQKKSKKSKKEGKAKVKSSESSAGSSSESKGAAKADGDGQQATRQAWMAKQPAAGPDDFFSKLGTDRERQPKLKPDPEKVSEREYNPFLRGEESAQPVPEASGVIPKHLTVGDGGALWRKRAQKRAQEAGLQEEPAPAAAATAPAQAGQGGGRLPAAARRPSRSRSRSGSRRQRWRSRSRSRSGSPGGRRGGGAAAGAARPRSRSPPPAEAQPRAAPGAAGWRKRAQQRQEAAGRPPEDATGATPSASSSAKAAGGGAGEESDDVMRRMQEKYGGARADATSGRPAAAVHVVEPEDANALGALAMEAMLAGDMARYEELNRRLEKRQAKMAKAATASQGTTLEEELAAAMPTAGHIGSRVRVLEEVDAAGRSKALKESVQTTSVRTKGRNKRGTANAVPGRGDEVNGFYEDDGVSLEDLIRRERIEGVQDYDANITSHILKQGAKFKMLHEDEDEAYALGWYESADKKMDAKTRGEKQRLQDIRDRQRIQVNLEHCRRCMESRRFMRRDQIISVSQHAYVCMEAMEHCILPGQLLIVPLEHVQASTDMDEAAWAEIRNYQKCLVRYFEAEDPPKAVIFAESAVHRVSRDKALMGAGLHAGIVAYPVEVGLLQEVRAYWKKALDEAECEFTTQHKKVIETDGKGGVRAKIPKGFPYVHADFSLGGGYAHVVEDASEFPRDFMQHTVAGMCELTVLDRAYSSKEAWRKALEDLKSKFTRDFDWTRALPA